MLKMSVLRLILAILGPGGQSIKNKPPRANSGHMWAGRQGAQNESPGTHSDHIWAQAVNVLKMSLLGPFSDRPPVLPKGG